MAQCNAGEFVMTKAEQADCIIAKMRDGLSLRQCFASSGPYWFLSDGTRIHPDAAKIIITHTNIVGAGDCLFPHARAISQTFRWSKDAR
jgi:hypothetical protein